MSTNKKAIAQTTIQERHLSQPSGRIALMLALQDDGETLSRRQQAEVAGWQRMIGKTRICAYEPDSREGWWIVPRRRGETGWFRFPAS